ERRIVLPVEDRSAFSAAPRCGCPSRRVATAVRREGGITFSRRRGRAAVGGRSVDISRRGNTRRERRNRSELSLRHKVIQIVLLVRVELVLPISLAHDDPFANLTLIAQKDSVTRRALVTAEGSLVRAHDQESRFL